MTDHTELDACIAQLYNERLVYSANFVRQSASRNSGEKRKTLNWRIALATANYRLDTDYYTGIGNVPGYVHSFSGMPYETRLLRAAQEKAAETGYYPDVVVKMLGDKSVKCAGVRSKQLPAPLLRDVLYSFVQDAQCVEGRSFEEFASEFGYDTDSRKAERIYVTSLRLQLALQSLLGQETVEKLVALFQDY